MHEQRYVGVPQGEPTMKLYEGFSDNLRVPAGKKDVLVFDDGQPGFGIRKFADGRAHYFVKYAIGNKQRRFKIGEVVRGNLKDMRLRAAEIRADARRGIDVAAQKERAAREAAQTVTLGELVPIYLAKRQGELRASSYSEVERYLRRTWQPLHDTAIKDVTRQAIVRIIDGFGHKKVSADRARVALSTFFAWAVEAGHCENNPTMHIKARADKKPRERVLSEPELVEVWNACEDDDFGAIIKLLILTGQRREEIGGLRWPEIKVDKRQIELPGARTKNHRAHIIPLANAALELLQRVEPIEGRPHLFGIGHSGFTVYDRCKKALDARIAARRERRGDKPLDHWTLHDLRRSFTTHINELGYALPHVVEAILNHISGAKAGVAGTYNRATYLKEKRETLERWAAYITGQADSPLFAEQTAEHGKSRQTTR
jgi:integrase